MANIISISDSTNTTSSTSAASSTAVKTAYDKAVSATPVAGTGVAVSTTTTGTTVSLSPVFSTQTTNVAVGNAGNQTPGYGATFKVPYFTYDKYGRIASASTYTVKIPASDNSHCSYCSYCNCESSYCDCKHCSYCTYCTYCTFCQCNCDCGG